MKYRQVWIAAVRIIPHEGFLFCDLIDLEDAIDETDDALNPKDIKGAWCNIFLRAPDIREALDIIPFGLKELNFEVDVIASIENVQSIVDNDDLSAESIDDLNRLLETNYKFKMTGRIFPFDENEFVENPFK